MVRGRKAGIAAALAVVAVAAVTAGCGGGTDSAVSLDPVAAAATKTQNAGAARVHVALAIKSPQIPGKKLLRLNATGAIDGTSSELSFPLLKLLTALPAGALPQNLTNDQVLHSSLKEIAQEQNGDYVVYLSLGPLVASQLPGGKEWIKLDLSKLGKSAGVDLSKLMSGAQFQPGDLLSMLRSEGATVHTVGSATIDGTATTHYRVSVDVAKALKKTGLTSPSLAAAAGKMKTVTENVWIGKDGLLRRVQSAFGSAKSHVALTMNLYDYGANVNIAAPPSSSTYDVTPLAQGLGSLN
jgi:LppX_LprAFG lipoprotein